MVSTRPYTVLSLSANATVDYTALSNVAIVFNPGDSIKTVTIPVLTSGVHAYTTYFEVYLSSSTVGTSIDVARASSFVAVLGSVGSFSFASNNFTFLETDGTVHIPVMRTGGACGAVTLEYELENQALTTAIVGTNFVLDSPVVTFADGQTMANLTVDIIHTATYEYYSLFFVLELVAPTDRGQLGSAPLTRVIISDAGDAGIFEFAASTTICREDNGTAIVWINRTVGMSTSAVAPVLLTVETVAGGNATEGSSRAFDYQHASQVMSWADGETLKSFSISVFNNAVYDPRLKSIWIRLTAVSGGATIAAGHDTTVVYIVDDRDAGTFSFDTSNYTVSEGAASVNLLLKRSGINNYTSGTVTVDVLTYSGVVRPGLSLADDGFDYGVVSDLRCTHVSPCTAVAGQHYTALPVTTLTFASGESQKTISISIVRYRQNNDLYEAPNRVFKVLLRNVQGGAHIGLDYEHPIEWSPSWMTLDASRALVPNYISAVVTIQDDGDPAVLISKASLSTSELGQSDTYLIVLNAAPTAPVGVELTVDNPQVKLSVAQVVFTTANWNVPQTVGVTAVDDAVAQGVHVVHVTHVTTSTDARYNGGARQTVGSTGVVYGSQVYTERRGDYDQGNDHHAFPWDASTFGVQTAPSSPILNAFVLDNDYASIVVVPEQIRHTVNTPSNFVCARQNGHVASVTVALSSKPTAAVTLTLVPASTDVVVAPWNVTLTPSTWRSGGIVTVAYSGSTSSTTRVDISSASTDAFYSAKSSAFYVEGLPASGIALDKTTAMYYENGSDDSVVDYTVRVVSEPMHWEIGSRSNNSSSTAVPYTTVVLPLDDVSASKASSSPSISLENGSILHVATNSSESTNSSSIQKVSFLRFSRGSGVVARTGSPRVGLALLRLYRLVGGDNRGLGGVQVGVFNPPAPPSWNESSCDGVCVTSLLPAATSFGFVHPTSLCGSTDVLPQGSFNATLNAYASSPGWIDIDVTAAWNTNATDLTDITFALVALQKTSFVYENVDEIQFASLDHPMEALRPHVQLTASGLVNVAQQGIASQSSSDNVNASQPLAGGPTALTREAWWDVTWSAPRFIESIVVNMVVPTPQSSSSILLTLMKDANTVTSTTLPVVTTDSFSSVQLAWHVHGQTGAVDPLSMYYRPNLTALVEATSFRIDTQNAAFTLLSVQVFQVPMAASRVAIGSYLPSPSSLLADVNELRLDTDDPIVADHRPTSATNIYRNELLFTAGQWQDAQTVHVSVINNDVATGPRIAGISHTSFSSDPDYDSPQVGLCATSGCTSPLQTTMALTVLDDDEAGGVMSTTTVNLAEGASVYPGGPIPTTVGRWQPSNPLWCSWNAQTQENTTCVGVFQGTPYMTCLVPSAPLFANGSAWLLVPVTPPQPTFRLREVHVELPAASVRAVKTISLWTSDQSSTRNASTWTFVGRQTAQFGASAVGFMDLNEAMILSYLAVHIEASYDVTTHCVDVSSIELWGDVWREGGSVDITRLSKTHARGALASVSVRLLSEPLAEVVFSPGLMSTYLVGFDGRNGSQNAASLHQVTGGVYGYASYSAMLPTALHFNASNWNQAQDLVLAAVDDNVGVGNRTATCTYTTWSADTATTFHESAVSRSVAIQSTTTLPQAYQYNVTTFVVSDTLARDPTWPYHVTPTQTPSTGSITMTATITEDDSPGFTVSPAPLEVIEKSSQDLNFSVVLDSQPTASVTVQLSVGLLVPSAQPGLVSMQPSSLTFTPESWFVPQYVFVTVPYKAGFEGNESSTVRYTPTVPKKYSELIVQFAATSGDPAYHGRNVGTNDASSVAFRANGIPLIVDDIDTGCAHGYEYTCANDQPRIEVIVSCQAAASSTSTASCVLPSSFSPFDFVSAVHTALVSLEFTAADGTAYPKQPNRAALDTSLYIVRVDPVPGIPSMRVVLDVADTAPAFPAASKLQALFKNGFMSQAPLFATSLVRVSVMPRAASASIVLWVFVGLVSVGAAVGTMLTLRKRQVNVPLLVAPHDNVHDLIHDTLPLVR
ncbi:hypothetical protein DYB31_004916 [Aphanomyces astaci]|uniref:Calx-beta domain-containing protein n=1 Tax=Aphanomyces astaci TaxID=112090 RepID=A0A397F695_APHAT|nr:hypothetical protein DYB31_004916 [Aphanomyces astaci]